MPHVESLQTLLQRWGVPNANRVSHKWRATLAPHVPETTTGELDANVLVHHLTSGTPCMLPTKYAARLHAAAGRDGLAHVTANDRGFKKQRLAMLGGWGAPGTPLVDDDNVTFCESFTEALASPAGRVNLQAFHRDDDDGDKLLPALLDWPLPEMLFGDAAGANATATPLATRVDMATRVSQAGAVTWWHLDDGGEVTLQVALPVDLSARDSARPLVEPVIRDTRLEGSPVVVKVFIFVPREAYTMIFDDVECNKSGRWASLDIFDTPDWALPDADKLPIIMVAPLAAGGAPLLSPPNAPHYVVTEQDCCMCEQRVVLHAHMDEAWHFLSRARTWAEPPIVYPVLRAIFGDSEGGGGGGDGEAARGREDATFAAPDAICEALVAQHHDESVPRAWRERVTASLRCLSKNAKIVLPSAAVVETPPDRMEYSLEQQALLEASCEGKRGVVRLGWACSGGSKSNTSSSVGVEPGGWCCVIHESGKPRYGPERASFADAVKDRKKFIAARKQGRDALREAMLSACNVKV
ncbi:hypothetical protein NFJ02_07g134400 [Pycnococcus provasolii]